MVTKFISLENKKESKKTVFKKYITSNSSVEKAISEPSCYDNVLHIGYDKDYGDVFKAWNDNSPNDFVIYFGAKGDEFE